MYGVLTFFSVSLLILSKATIIGDKDEGYTKANRFIGCIGAIVEYTSRIGKEEKKAMEMAMEDSPNGSNIVLHVVDSHGNSAQAISAAIDLIHKQRVQGLIGALTLQEATLTNEIGKSTKEIPIISLATVSLTPPSRLRFFIPLAQDISLHMRCIASIIGSNRWRKIIAIYEDSNTYTSDSGIITLLSDVLRDIGSDIEHHSSFPPLASLPDPKTVVREELKKLKSRQCKVFVIVQSSLPLAIAIFKEAKKIGMMEKGYVWITTDSITSLLNSVNSSVLSSMQGILGFKSYFSDTSASFRDFKARFWHKYHSQYPQEESVNPSIFALRAYDAITTMAQSMEKIGADSTAIELFQGFLSSDYKGLSGKLSQQPTFCIVNVVGKSQVELGFWSKELGFSENERSGGESMEVLKPVYWPGGSRSVPRGWTALDSSDAAKKRMKIGVPSRPAFTQFVRVNYDHRNHPHVTGFSVKVFDTVLKQLPYKLPYELVPFNGSYDDMVEQVYLKVNTNEFCSFVEKTFDAVVGDTTIMADRYRYAEFSQPYAKSSLVMVVTVQPEKSQEAWMFLKPFTKEMWILTAALGVFTGFVVWLNEYDINPEFGGTISYQIGTFVWFSFTTLFFAQREPLKSNLSRLVVATWLFLVLIVISSYTASLTSMLTVSRFKPSVTDIEFLKRTNAAVGCDANSFIITYLVEVLGFKIENIVNVSSIDDYPEALSSGKLAAAFFVTLHAKVFLAKYCNGFTIAGPSFELGGFGFVFPKGSPLAFDISEAILRVTESGEMQKLEDDFLSSYNCSTFQSTQITGTPPLSPRPFSGFFFISAGVSIMSLFTVLVRRLRNHWQLVSYIQFRFPDIRIWSWASTLLMKHYILKRDARSNNPNQTAPATHVEEELTITEPIS
ncbi:hypothetical protein GIB67_030459 [Kingdonia uniflora]|uniref:Glutamate receptor n=1 Tax=Kingdonia uniflora TaxID=39325 RepID=A0A7J7P731_9MAGN|nr:hypothetical protein GIB67_030459 [Kingdonia uniflora]